jgi:hypothetical protein
MASTIGQGAWGDPKNAFMQFPRDPLSGSTSGIGGQSSESHGRYPAGPTHEFKYQPGSRRFWKLHRANHIGPKGTWGQAHYQKFNPVKQIGGSAGYLNQKPGIKRSSDFNVIVNVGRAASNPFIPRGGNVMRVVGTENQENPGSYTGGYNDYFGGNTKPGVQNQAQIPPPAPPTFDQPGNRGPATPQARPSVGGGPVIGPVRYPNLDDDADVPLGQLYPRGADMSRRNAQYIQNGAQTTSISDQPNVKAPEEKGFFEQLTEFLDFSVI